MIPPLCLNIRFSRSTSDTLLYEPGLFLVSTNGRPRQIFLRWRSEGLPGFWGILVCICSSQVDPDRANPVMPFQQFRVVPAIKKTKTTALH